MNLAQRYLLSVPRVVEILAELRNITVCEGEDAAFKCVVSPEDARLAWRFNGKQVTAGGRVVISSNGLCHMLCIHNCTVSDSTRVTAEAEGLVSEAELQVQGERFASAFDIQVIRRRFENYVQLLSFGIRTLHERRVILYFRTTGHFHQEDAAGHS